MQNENNPYIDHSSWLDCIISLQQPPPYFEEKPLSLQPFVQLPPDQQSKVEIKEESNLLNEEILSLISLHQCVDKDLFKRSHPEIMMEEQFFTSNSSQNELIRASMFEQDPKSGYKKQKYAKQYIYSKNYRDKKKQQFKALQSQNQYLKNKIDELQYRLRQKQLQINRLKHHSAQKQLTIQELNRQFITKVSLFAEKIQSVMDKSKTSKLPSDRQNLVYEELIRTYDEHGFFGSRKKQILSYYIDQMLEVVLRDSQKYLCLLCCKNKDDKLEKQFPQYQKINNAFFQIVQLNSEDEVRLKKYISFLYPVMKEIKKQCSDLYKNYSKIINSMDKVHQFMKVSYTENLDFVKKRMKLESWFQYHKYHKIMRKLKSDWLDYIKKEKDPDTKIKNKHKTGMKKNKTDQIKTSQS